jgi:hypothetical protein
MAQRTTHARAIAVQPKRDKTIMRKITRTAFAIGGIAATAAALTACGTPSVTRPATPPAAPASNAAFTPPPAAPATPAAPPAPVTTGPLGTTFVVTSTDETGNPVSYRVTLVKVDQRAALGPYETTQNPADHMAAARFTITGVTGQSSDDADSDANAIGTDTTEYQASFTEIADGPNFNSGEFEAGPGQTVSGWVPFEIPSGQRVASVQWSAGFDGPAATWTLRS